MAAGFGGWYDHWLDDYVWLTGCLVVWIDVWLRLAGCLTDRISVSDGHASDGLVRGPDGWNAGEQRDGRLDRKSDY